MQSVASQQDIKVQRITKKGDKMTRKPELRVPIRHLTYGKKYGVTLKEAKKAYLSGMTETFKRTVKIKFVR